MPTKCDETWEVMPMTEDMVGKTLELEGRDYTWGRSGGMHIRDEGIAHAIQDKYGHKVIIDKVKVPHISDRGHKYFFAVPELPWHKERDNGN